MVVGIVHKNGILMLDAEKHFTDQGSELQDAIYQAGRRRHPESFPSPVRAVNLQELDLAHSGGISAFEWISPRRATEDSSEAPHEWDEDDSTIGPAERGSHCGRSRHSRRR